MSLKTSFEVTFFVHIFRFCLVRLCSFFFKKYVLKIVYIVHFYTHFQMQVQAISMQTISPNTIPTKNLRHICLPQRHTCLNISNSLKVPQCFYRNHIIITTFIQLVEYSYHFDIFQAYSLPVPLVNDHKGNDNDKDLLAYYILESEFVRVSSYWSKYILGHKLVNV